LCCLWLCQHQAHRRLSQYRWSAHCSCDCTMEAAMACCVSYPSHEVNSNQSSQQLDASFCSCSARLGVVQSGHGVLQRHGIPHWHAPQHMLLESATNLDTEYGNMANIRFSELCAISFFLPSGRGDGASMRCGKPHTVTPSCGCGLREVG